MDKFQHGFMKQRVQQELRAAKYFKNEMVLPYEEKVKPVIKKPPTPKPRLQLPQGGYEHFRKSSMTFTRQFPPYKPRDSSVKNAYIRQNERHWKEMGFHGIKLAKMNQAYRNQQLHAKWN